MSVHKCDNVRKVELLLHADNGSERRIGGVLTQLFFMVHVTRHWDSTNCDANGRPRFRLNLKLTDIENHREAHRNISLADMRRLLEWEYSFRYAKKAKSMQTLGTWMRARRAVQPAELITWMLSHVCVRMDSKSISGTPYFANCFIAAPEFSFQFFRARYADSIPPSIPPVSLCFSISCATRA